MAWTCCVGSGSCGRSRCRGEQATRVEARDFCRWVQIGGKPSTKHWRRRDDDALSVAVPSAASSKPNPVTGKSSPGLEYASSTAAHGESVLRGFYDFHLDAGTGPIVNPFPLVRRFNARRGQRHLSGRWWSGTDGVHVGYESWLERDHVMALDFDATVVAIASQPFRLSWTTVEGKTRSHVPDYFARRVDGSAVVVDCRPVERRPLRDVAAFEATRQACGLLGWEYRLVGAPDANQDRESAVVGRVPASAPWHPGVGRGATGGVRRVCAAAGGRGGGG